MNPVRSLALHALRLIPLPWVLAAMLAACGAGEGDSQETAGGDVTLRIAVDPVAKAREVNDALAAEFTRETGIGVEFVIGPSSANERLTQYLQFLGAHSSDIDIYQIDVTWPGMLAPHFVDLGDAFEIGTGDYLSELVENNTVEGRLIAAPWFADAGMLYYRTDLLEEYGYEGPPATWDELESMAAEIQAGERERGNPDFWGFVWQGRAYEGLTCNALEWQVAHGGGTIVDAGGKVTVNNEDTERALRRAAGWVGSISPPGVTSYQEEEARVLFQNGKAAFMRNWPYAYPLAQGEDSPVRDRISIAPLPREKGPAAATLGGWQLAVSAYSEHAEEAIRFVKAMTSAPAQKKRFLEAGLIPTRPALLDDPEVVESIPYASRLSEVLAKAVARPSTAAGRQYNEVSTAYFTAVHHVLTGNRDAKDVLPDLEQDLAAILGRSRARE